MDPKAFSDFIREHGQIVGVVRPAPSANADPLKPTTITYKFDDGAEVQYTEGTFDKNGNQITAPQFVPDLSKVKTPMTTVRSTDENGNAVTLSVPTSSLKGVTPGTTSIDLTKPATTLGTDLRVEDDGAGGKIIVERSITKDGTGVQVIYQGPPRNATEVALVKGEHDISNISRQPVAGGLTQITTVKKDANGNTTSGITYENADGTPAAAPGSTPIKSSEKEPAPGFPGVYIVRAGSKAPDGSTASETYYVNDAGERVDQPVKPTPESTWRDPKTGTLYAISVDTNGHVTGQRTIEGGPSTGTHAPVISDTSAAYGQVADDLRTKIAGLAQRVRDTAGSDNPYTTADMERDGEIERKLAQAKVDEITGAAQEQRLIQTGERGEAQNRRSWADQAFKNAQGLIGNDTRALGPDVGKHYAQALTGLMKMQYGLAKSIGGFNTPERTPLQNQILQAGGGQAPSVTVTVNGAQQPPQAQQAPSPGLGGIGDTLGSALGIGGVDISQSGGPLGMPGSGGGVAPGMNFGGGQLTAPGVGGGMGLPPPDPEAFNWDASGLFDNTSPELAAAGQKVLSDYGFG